MKRYRAVLWDYPEGGPGGGGSDSTLSYEQLPKTKWWRTREAAQEDGENLNAKYGHDFFVRIEEEDQAEEEKGKMPPISSTPDANESTRPYFVIWHDYVDGVSHGKVIQVPNGKDPESEAYGFLTDYVGMNNYLIESIREAKEGDAAHEF